MRKSQILLRWFRGQLLYALAYVWRRLLFKTTFIAITGSVGKTTTKECLAAVLGAHHPIAKTLNNQNDWCGAPATILRVRPWHRFAVIEIGTDRPGLIRRSARMVRPHIAILLSVARTHTAAFPSLQETAAEKAQIFDWLAPGGLALANADDPWVAEIASRCRCEVRRFGRAQGVDLRADEVRAKWPARLSLRVVSAQEDRLVHTNLVGDHWLSAVLASLLAATSCGLTLSAAAREVERVLPFTARMQPLRLPSGAILLRDEQNGSADTFVAALQVFNQVQAQRKILILSDISDTQQRQRARLRELGRAAAQAADLAIFVGAHSHYGMKAARSCGMSADRALHFEDINQAALYLKTELRDGDFVLIKGRTTDHLSRVVLSQLGAIGCIKQTCPRTIVCDVCEDLRPQFDLHAALKRLEPRREVVPQLQDLGA